MLKLEEIKTALEELINRGYKNINLDNEIVSVMPSDDEENVEIVFKDDAETIVITKWGTLRPQYNLKPCPFCGGEAAYRTALGVCWVTCIKCGTTTNATADEKTAIDRWNQRTEEEDTRINVYENLWNILKESMKAKSRNWMPGFEIFMDMEKMERIQKGIPEEDEEEE
jgi:Lar family restriction alleviation protein